MREQGAGHRSDVEVHGTIRPLLGARPAYRCRQVAALLKRGRRSDGMVLVNAKRVYELVTKYGPLLDRPLRDDQTATMMPCRDVRSPS